MTCKHFNDGVCAIATGLAGSSVFPIVSQCKYCTEEANPSQAINRVTVSIALKGAVDVATQKRIMSLYGGILRRVSVIESQGPGTELKNLISLFYSPYKRKCSRCSSRVEEMNKWGESKCWENKSMIVSWLQQSAKIAKIPYANVFGLILLAIAIKLSRFRKLIKP